MLIDRNKTVACYIKNVQTLTRLPFVTDEEMSRLFGEDVENVLLQLAQYDKETQLCADCQKRCCPVAHCEIYDVAFPACPIYPLRPVVCRVHYCHLFQQDRGSLVEALSDIFFDCMNAAEAAGIPHTRLFDSPPLARCAPEFVVNAQPFLQQFRDGKISAEQAAAEMMAIAEKHRSPAV